MRYFEILCPSASFDGLKTRKKERKTKWEDRVSGSIVFLCPLLSVSVPKTAVSAYWLNSLLCWRGRDCLWEPTWPKYQQSLRKVREVIEKSHTVMNIAHNEGMGTHWVGPLAVLCLVINVMCMMCILNVQHVNVMIQSTECKAAHRSIKGSSPVEDYLSPDHFIFSVFMIIFCVSAYFNAGVPKASKKETS